MKGRKIIDRLRDWDKRISRSVSNSRRILIDAKTPMNLAVMAPVFRELSRDPRLTLYFTSSNGFNEKDVVFKELQDRRNLIGPARIKMLRFDAYLAADLLWPKLPRGTRRVFMFHGVAGKYSDVYDRPDSSMRHWDRIFFINRKRLENFVAAGAIDRDSPAACLIGYPKLDCLVNGSLRRDETLTKLGMDPTRSVILYAPTWSPYSSLNAMGEDLVRRLRNAGYQIIVKLHDRSLYPEYEYSGGVQWAERLEPILANGGGFLARDSDATPYLAAADVMITDHSSVGFEYLLVDRPIIRIEMPELIRATRIPEDYVDLLAEASLTVKTADEAVRAVDHCLANPSVKSISRRRVAGELFFQPGTATSRAVGAIYQLLELDPITAPTGLRDGNQET